MTFQMDILFGSNEVLRGLQMRHLGKIVFTKHFQSFLPALKKASACGSDVRHKTVGGRSGITTDASTISLSFCIHIRSLLCFVLLCSPLFPSRYSLSTIRPNLSATNIFYRCSLLLTLYPPCFFFLLSSQNLPLL